MIHPLPLEVHHVLRPAQLLVGKLFLTGGIVTPVCVSLCPTPARTHILDPHLCNCGESAVIEVTLRVDSALSRPISQDAPTIKPRHLSVSGIHYHGNGACYQICKGTGAKDSDGVTGILHLGIFTKGNDQN